MKNTAAKQQIPLHLPDRKVRVGRIRYINVAPVYFGLDNGMRPPWVKLVNEPPAVLNRMLERGELDISPVSSVAYARNHKKWLLLPNNSISCFGEVMSVLLASKFPFDQLNGKTVLLTEESASAAGLLKLLFSKKNVHPVFREAQIKNPGDVQEADAALIIGDRALSGLWTEHFPFVMDLGATWKDFTGLPFVFAVWAVRKNFARDFPDAVEAVAELFRISRENGQKHLDQISCKSAKHLGFSPEFCNRYYTHIKYDLDYPEKMGLECFLYAMYKEKMLPGKVRLTFI